MRAHFGEQGIKKKTMETSLHDDDDVTSVTVMMIVHNNNNSFNIIEGLSFVSLWKRYYSIFVNDFNFRAYKIKLLHPHTNTQAHTINQKPQTSNILLILIFSAENARKEYREMNLLNEKFEKRTEKKIIGFATEKKKIDDSSF